MYKKGQNIPFVKQFFFQILFGRENPFHAQQLKIFGKEKPSFNALIFTKYSPLKPIFNLGWVRLRENGKYRKTYSDWEGLGDPGEASSVDKMVLAPGQIILVYGVMGFAFVTCLTILCCEKVMNWGKKRTIQKFGNVIIDLGHSKCAMDF